VSISYSKSRKGKEGNGLIVGICFDWKISEDFIFKQKEGDIVFLEGIALILKRLTEISISLS